MAARNYENFLKFQQTIFKDNTSKNLDHSYKEFAGFQVKI